MVVGTALIAQCFIHRSYCTRAQLSVPLLKAIQYGSALDALEEKASDSSLFLDVVCLYTTVGTQFLEVKVPVLGGATFKTK